MYKEVGECATEEQGLTPVRRGAACFIDWFSEEGNAAAVPNWNFTHISDDVLPALRERGVTEEQITTMMVDNARRYFETA
jgi:phosphotriesterase-related protein